MGEPRHHSTDSRLSDPEAVRAIRRPAATKIALEPLQARAVDDLYDLAFLNKLALDSGFQIFQV